MEDLKMINRFVTHSHSMYSNFRIIDSINKPKDMIITVNKLGLSGVVLTDHETVAGHVDWLKQEKELKEKGIIPQEFKCGCGNEIYLVDDRNNIEKYWHYILIAKNNMGHRALRELSSIAWYNGFSSRGMMRVPTEKRELEEIVEKYPDCLIATNACLGGQLDHFVLELVKAERNENEEEIYKWKSEIDNFIKWNLNLFGEDFYLEIAAGRSREQINFNERIKSIAKAYNIKIIIGDDAHYLTAKERPIHKAYLNSKEGEREVDEFYQYAHFMDNNEAYGNLEDLYSEDEFIEICNNSMEIFDKIEGYDLSHSPIIPRTNVKDYPKFEFNEDFETIKYLTNSDNIQERYWINECLNGLKNKKLWNQKYLARIETEANIIKTVGGKLNNCLFEYFNTFQSYIDLFWECGSVTGPGRGSSVCFLSNYLLGITQLDPLEWNLPEWRFLNAERTELPDIDCDLAPSKRKHVFEKIREQRGELNLLQVCTYGTEGTRSAIAAACRGYRSSECPDGIDSDVALYLSSLIPQERGFLRDIDDCVYGNEEKGYKPIQALIDEFNKYPGLLEIVQSIKGIINKRGQHASGVIIYNNNPFETNAIMRSPNGDLTTQYDLGDSEYLGDVKFDMLVTEICDKIGICIKLLQRDELIDPKMSLREVYDTYLHPSKIDINDNRLWDALGEGKVLDVFQFSDGVGLATAKRIKPRNPNEMISANALMRLSGEAGKERPIDRYCRLRANMNLWYQEVHDVGLTEKEIKNLEQYYLPNFGTPTAQEDLMMVCLDENIAHFTLSEANYARKVVAKKKIKEVPALKEKFVSQCPRRVLGEYVWETVMNPQMSYA